jgi:hypothetical protein
MPDNFGTTAAKCEMCWLIFQTHVSQDSQRIMATAGPTRLVDKLDFYNATRSHTVWDRFTVEDKERMLADDLAAGTSVSLVLSTLITIGLVLSAVTLAAVLLMQ